MGHKSSYEIALTQKDGKQISCLVNASPYYDNTGEKVGSFAMVTDISAQKAIERALKDSELRYRTLFESSNDAIFLLKDDQFSDYNPRTLEIFGCTAKILRKSTFTDFLPSLQPSGRSSKAVLAGKIDEARGGRDQNFEWQFVRNTGTFFYTDAYMRAIQICGEEYLFIVLRDTTEKKTLEMQLQQAQKMEAIGRLAGGVAHDFNNLLTVIRGYSDLILTRLDQTEAIFHRVKQIDLACERAESLTKQLLAFGRRQILKPKIIDMNHQIRQMGIMLRRMIGEHIKLVYKLEPGSILYKSRSRSNRTGYNEPGYQRPGCHAGWGPIIAGNQKNRR